MIKKLVLYILFFQSGRVLYSQIVISTPQNITIDTYTRDKTSITLKPGFVYGATATSPHLLNLNISNYPAYVNNNYFNPPPFASGATFGNTQIGTTAGQCDVSPTGGDRKRTRLNSSHGYI